jgi:NADPH-dependent glutamate synthase beta subunit-like oxidoreductase
MYLVARERFDEANVVIRKTNPFPSVCGRVCPHNCEMGCTRTHVDEPISIGKTERAAADYGHQHLEIKKNMNRGPKVAVIGSGPCGLTAALDLVRAGYRVTVYEKASVPGGTIRLGIAPFRLPNDIVDNEVEYITRMGVTIKTNTEIGKDISFEKLRGDYSAIFIAAGAYSGGQLHLHDHEIEEVKNGATFMSRVNTGKSVGIKGQKVVVVGGGYTSVDAARTAVRLGAKNVSIVFARTRKEMTNTEEELKATEEEGVDFHLLARPNRPITDSGQRVTGLECIKVEIKGKDELGRKMAVPIQGTEFVIEADTIINALDTSPDTSFLPENAGFKFSKTGLLSANGKTMETNIPGIFIGGDYLTGTRDVVNSIADGHKAAISMDAYLRKEDGDAPKPHEVKLFETKLPDMHIHYEIIPRAKMPLQDSLKRITNFKEVELGLSKKDAKIEAQRCLQCNNIWILDDESCIQCGQCVEACPRNCLSMPELNIEQKDRFFYEGMDLMNDNIHPVSVTLKHCIRCGVCEEVCPSDAIAFKSCEPTNIKILSHVG